MSPTTPTATSTTTRRRRREALGAFLVALSVLGSVLAAPAGAAPNGIHSGQLVSSSDAAEWTPHVLDGFVGAIAEVGDTVVVGGRFNQIASAAAPDTPINRPNLFSFQKFTGTINSTFSPAINGEVTSILPTGDGRTVWVAGGFNTLNGQTNRNLVKIDVVTGQRVAQFAPPALNGQINDLQLRNGKLYLTGRFTLAGTQPRPLLAAVDPVTGALDPAVHAAFALPRRNSFLTIASSDITPDGTKMIVTGNFTQVNGQERHQIALLDLTTSPVSVANWHTARYGPTCGGIWPTYLRDIDFSPDGSYFVVVTTGAYSAPGGGLCDAAARWETGATGSNLQPTWVDLSGGDTLTAVAITDTAVYIGGHQRWSNNPFAADRIGPGAVTREGLVALDPRSGATLSWNPGRTRRVAVYDMVATSTGLWIGSDSDRIAGFQQRRRLAFLALDPSSTMKAEFTGELPGQVVSLGSEQSTTNPASTRMTTRTFTGTSVTGSSTIGETGTMPSALAATSYTVSTFAGSGAGGATNGSGTGATFNSLGDLAFDAGGDLYVADTSNNRIRRITPAGVVTTFAGSGAAGATDGVGAAATFRNPYGLAFDAAGNLFVADGGNNRIRRITPDGVVTTFAGSGGAGWADGTGMAALFNLPQSLSFDAAGDLFVSDYGNNRIRRITPAGVVTTFAGSGVDGYLDGTGTAARFSRPWGTAFDAAGNLFVADRTNHRIRRITPAGVVTTVAGSGEVGDIDGTGTAASLNEPIGLVVEPNGDLLITDHGGHKVRRVTQAGVVTTIAGSGAAGAASGSPTGSVLSGPVGLERAPDGTMFVSEWSGRRIVRVQPAGTGNLLLSWSPPTVTGGAAITDYTVEYRTSPDGAWTTFDDGVSTVPRVTLTGLAHGTAHDVRVSAVTAAGTGPASEAITATPGRNTSTTATPGPGNWTGLRGAFMVDGKLYTGWANGALRVQDFDGTTFGPPSQISMTLAQGTLASLNRFATEDLSTVTGMFYDRVTGRLYFARSNSSSLHHRTFSPESRIVGGERFASAANAGGVTWSNVRTMFLASGKLYTSDASGNLTARDWNAVAGVPSGTPTTVSGPAIDGHDWRAADTFVHARAGVEVPNAAPSADFTVSCTQGTCRVDGSASSDPDGAVASHAWDFGDGSGTGAGTTAHHVYAASGTHTITLTVTDHRGATATTTRTVQVLLPNVAPVASFRPVCDGLDCTFDTAGTGDADGSITAWSWNFGDGTTATSPTPEHRYASAGTRAVSLTVTDDRGATSTMSTNLAVIDPEVRPEARFRAANGSVASATSATVRVPSQVRAGDVMVLVATSSSHSAPLAAPAGWTLLSSGNNATATAGTAAWTRTATAANAGANVRVTTTATSKMTLQVAAYSGAAGVSAHRVAFDTVSRATRTTPNVDVATSGSAVLSVWSDKSNDNTGWDLPAGTTLRHEAVGTRTGHMTTALADTAPVDAGAAGGLAAVADSANRRGLVWSIVIAPDTTPPNLLPIATFSSNCSGLVCTFDASASTDPDGTVAATSWSIGGTTHTGPTASRTFPAAGTHPVTVTVTDALGATNSATRSVTVAVPAPGVARFRASTGTNVNAALATVTVPGPVAVGDRMLLLSTTNGAGAVPTAPAGWTLVESTSNAATDTTSALWTKVAEGADTGSTVTVTTEAMVKASLHLVAYSNAGTISARALSFHTTDRSGRTTPMLLAATPGSTLVSYWADKSSDTTTWNVPATAQLRHLSVGSGAGHITSALADSVSLSAGTTGGLTATADSSTVRGITWSIVIAPAPIAGIAPNAPAGLALTPGNSQLAATWTAPIANGGAAVIDYVVEYRTSPAGAWIVFPDGMSTATSATITGLTNGTAYDVRISAVNSAGTSTPSRTATATAAVWTPALLRSSVAVWLDAAEASTITLNGSTVSQWNDRSGNSRHLTQATATQQPLMVPGGLNGRDVMTFDGTNDILNRTTTGAAGLTTSSIISVFRLDSGGGSADVPMAIGSTGNVGRIRGLYRAPNSTTLGFAGWANDVATSTLSYDTGGGYHLFGFVQSAPSGPNNITLLRDGTAEARATASALSTTVDGFSVGSLQGNTVGNYHTAMSVGEVLVFHTAIDTATRQRVEGYLAHKWGLTANLPADHPYSITPP